MLQFLTMPWSKSLTKWTSRSSCARTQIIASWFSVGHFPHLFVHYFFFTPEEKALACTFSQHENLKECTWTILKKARGCAFFFVIRVKSPSTWVWGVRWGPMLKKLFFVSAVSRKVKFPFLLMVIDILCVHVVLLGSLSDIVFRISFVLVCQGAFLSGKLERGLTVQPYI